MKKIITAVLLLSVASCATPPERIAAVKSSAPCTVQDAKRLAYVTEKQAQKARNDAIGMLVIGLPVASMGNNQDHTAEIAQLKGRCQ